MLDAPAEEMREKAQILADLIASTVGDKLEGIDVVPEISRAGGGALPMCDIPTFVVRFRFERGDRRRNARRISCGKTPCPSSRASSRRRSCSMSAPSSGPTKNVEIVHALAAYFDNLNASA